MYIVIDVLTLTLVHNSYALKRKRAASISNSSPQMRTLHDTQSSVYDGSPHMSEGHFGAGTGKKGGFVTVVEHHR
jgi:hypothetical protein